MKGCNQQQRNQHPQPNRVRMLCKISHSVLMLMHSTECILPPANSALSTQLSQTHSESTLRRQPRHVRSLSPLLNSDDDTSNEPENSESTQSIGTENVDRLAEDGDGEDDDQLDMELFTIDERSSEETSGESAQCSSIAIRTEHHVDSVPHLSCSSMQDDADDYGDAANDDDETISYIRKVLANQARQTSEHLNPSPTLRSIDPITMLHSFTINDNGSSPIDASSSAVSPTAPEPANGVTSPLRSASESTSFFTSVNASVTLLHTHDLRASTIARRTNDSRQRNAIASPAGASPMYVRHSEKVSLINDSMMSMLSAAVSSTPRQHAAEHPKRTARLAALRQARNGVQDMSTIKYSGDNDAADDYDNANVSVDPDVAAYVHPNDRWMTRLAVRISPLPPITSDASSITSSVIAGAVGRTSSILTRSRCRLLCPSHTDGSECQDKHETGALSSTTSSLVAADVTASQSRRPKRQAAPTCLLDADRKRKLRNIEGVQTRRK